MHNNIYLIGFMGSGKTTVGQALARELGYTFVDMDQMIQDQAKKSISQIFSEQGEVTFRDLETQVLKSISLHNRHVVSTGGGAVLREENQQLMQSTGRTVLLWADPATVIDRLKDDHSRPLLQGDDKLQKITDLMETRKPVYLGIADVVTPTDAKKVDEIVYAIVEDLAILRQGASTTNE